MQSAVHRGLALVFDFDGTLAPRSDDPSAAQLRDHTRALLRAAAVIFPCAVISGRDRADTVARLRQIPIAVVVGNHGAEPEGAVPGSLARVKAGVWAAALGDALDVPGTEIVERAFGVEVRYHRSPAPREAERRIVELTSVLPRARIVRGHLTVSVLPIGSPSKGDAVAAIKERFGGVPVLYVGADASGEEVFRSRSVSYPIRVGRDDASAAHFFLQDQEEIDGLLRILVFERARVVNRHVRPDGSDPTSQRG